MGRLIYLMNMSLDGYVAAPDGNLDWATVDDELHTWFNDHTREMSASLYGRRLWELMAAHWPTGESDPAATEPMREYARLWNATPKIVFSNSLESVDHGARLVRGDIRAVLDEVRHEFDGDLEIGGPDLAGQFVRRGLVEEYRLVVHPVVLGGGKPFWPPLDAPIPLRAVDERRFATGAVMTAYRPA